MDAVDHQRRERWLVRALVVAGVAIAAARAYPRVHRPVLFAEDGQIFFADAYNRSVPSLWHPYNGYIHLLPRLIALGLSPLPMTAAPGAYALVAVAVTVVMFAVVLSGRLDWLIPSRTARAFAFALLAAAPMATEPYANIANLNFYGGVALVVISLLSDPDRSWRRIAEVVAVVVLGLSGPLGLLLWPLFGWRWWRNRRSRHSATLAVALAVTAVVQVVVYAVAPRSFPGHGTPAIFLRALTGTMAGSMLAGTPPSQNPTLLISVVAALWLVIVLIAIGRVLRGTAIAVLYALLALVGVATYAYGHAALSGNTRQYLVPHALLIIGLTAAAVAYRNTNQRGTAAAGRNLSALSKRARLIVPVVCLAVTAGGFARDLRVPASPVHPAMSSLARCVRADNATCTLATYPPGWRITLHTHGGASRAAVRSRRSLSHRFLR